MTSDRMTGDATGLTAAEIRACRVLDISPAAIARARRRRLLADTTDQEETMPDTTPELTDDEREIIARTGFDPARYAAIKQAPRALGGGIAVRDVLAAINTPSDDKE